MALPTDATRLRRRLAAPRSAVYRALTDAQAVARWMVPSGMTAEVHAFDAREGGLFRISLHYLDPRGQGKTTAGTDTYHGRFVRLVPDELVVESMEFESADPALRGAMTVTFRLADAGTGTDLLATHENLPRGLSTSDNEAGWNMALDKLAALVERADPMQSYYAARANEYDRIYAKPERQADLREIERWLPAELAGRAVLEVACGTGYWTQFIAPVASSVVAIDSSPETLRIAQARVAGGSVRFEVGDAYALRRNGQAFGAAFAGFWFSHVPIERRREFLLQLHAVLQPGARVVLLDNLFVEGSSTAISERDAAGNTYQSRTLADGSVHCVLKNFPAEDELRVLVAACGGDAAALRRWNHFWALSYRVDEVRPE